MESRRNEAVLKGIAEAFVKGVLLLCEHPALQYQWMRYLPSEIPEPFWQAVKREISTLLKKTPVLRPGSNGPLKLIEDLRVFKTSFKDEHDKPLFPDLPSEVYLASEYTEPDTGILTNNLDLRFLNIKESLDRIEFDLALPSSWFKSKRNDIDWNNRLANVLLRIYNKWEPYRKRIQSFAIIPLRGAIWASIADGPIFLPSTKDIDLPTDLGLRIIDSEAIKQPKRLELFLALGVIEASPDDVRVLIKEKYRYQENQVTLESSIYHLKYLYWTHTSDPAKTNPKNTSSSSKESISMPWLRQLQRNNEWSKISPGTAKENFKATIEKEPNSHSNQLNAFQTIAFQSAFQQFSLEELRLSDYTSGVGTNSFNKHWDDPYRWLSVICDDGEPYPCVMEIYMQSNHEFGIQNMVKAESTGSEADGKEIPGLSVKFLHPSYPLVLSHRAKTDHISWKDWMSGFLGISDVPQLEGSSTVGLPSLSRVLLYISKHKPERLLGMLMAHWKMYEQNMSLSISSLISNLEVPSRISMKRLRETYVPRQLLTDQCAKYIDCNKFPFLRLPNNSDPESWGFLECFKVELKDDIHFYLAILRSCISSNAIDRVNKLYEAIQYKYSDFTDQMEANTIVR